MQRESFRSRLGFLLVSAGCAIGIGNVWRFPYIAGLYGGGLFVLIYLICLLVMGVALLMALPSTLGYGIWSEVTIFGYQILDFFDFFSNNLLMPIVALLTAVLIGWVVKPKYVIEEVSLSGTFRARKLFCVMITYIVPVCMVIILLSSFLLDL